MHLCRSCLIVGFLRLERNYQPNKTFSIMTMFFFMSFSAGDHWFWVPIVGCFLGAVLGALAYIGLIEMHHPEDDPSKPGVELENITIKSNHE